jgi:hypothetical protein
VKTSVTYYIRGTLLLAGGMETEHWQIRRWFRRSVDPTTAVLVFIQELEGRGFDTNNFLLKEIRRVD